jgi:hypothetical protein
VPTPKNFFELLMEEAEGGKEHPSEVGMAAPRARGVRSPSIVDLALPYLKQLDPARARLAKLALQRMELIQQEGAVLMMPEFSAGR